VDMRLEVIVIPVADVDRAKAFYESLGWRLDADFSTGPDFRVVQVTPPGSACSIVFGKGLPSGAPIKGSQFVVQDITAAAEHLRSAGVEFNGPVHFEGGGMVPGMDPNDADFATFLFFDDPDGNSWAVQQGKRNG